MKSSTLPHAAFFIAVAFFTTIIFADDWPQWRGKDRSGISQESGLLQSWPEGGPNLVWEASGLGAGYSSISISDGKIFTLGDLEDGSYAIALNEADSSPAWRTRIGEAGGHQKYPGTRSTPTVAEGEVFVLNQHSDLACLDVSTGKPKWKVNLTNDFGGKMMSGWKYSESPLVDGDQVVVTPGGNEGTVLAIDRKTGKKRWQTSDWTDTAGYSSVVIATIHEVRQYIQLTGKSLAGLDPETGAILWKADRPGKTAVITTPVIDGDMIFVTSSYGIGCNGFKVSKSGDNWSAKEIYASKEISNHHGGVILLDGHVFGGSGSTFRCVDIQTGKPRFIERSVGKGATLYADDRFYLRSEHGPVALIKASPDGYEEVSRFDQPNRSDHKAWPHPVVANGKLYLRDQDLLLCYDVSVR